MNITTSRHARLSLTVSTFALALGAFALVPGSADAACTGLPSTGGNDTIVCDGAGSPLTSFNANPGNDTVTLDGTANGALVFAPGGPQFGDIVTGAGVDEITITGDVTIPLDLIVGGRTLGDSGDDVITIDDANLTVNNILGKISNDDFTITSSSVTGNIDAGGGEDDINATALALGGYMELGGDDDFLSFVDGSIGGSQTVQGLDMSVSGGGGADLIGIGNSDLAAGVSGGAGEDNIYIEGGTIGGTISPDDHADNVVLDGGVNVLGGIGNRGQEAGADNFLIKNATIGYTNEAPVFAGSPGQSVFTGGGDDSVGFFGGSIAGEINLGGDADVLVIDANADEYTNTALLEGTANYVGPVAPAPAYDSLVAVSGGAITATPQAFIGGGGVDTAQLFDLTTTEELVFRSVEHARFYGQSITLDNTSNNDSGFYLRTDAAGVHSTLTQINGELDIRNGGTSVLDVAAHNTVTMQDGAADDSIRVQKLNPQANSVFSFDADTSSGTDGYRDDLSDQIQVNSATPTGPVNVNVNLVGTGSLSGSRPLIDDINRTALENDPGIAANPNASTTYTLANDPSTAARAYWLEDEPDTGGVFLRYTTNINETTIGAGFLGGGVAAGTGVDDPNLVADTDDPATAALGLASSMGGFSVNNLIGDMASGSSDPTVDADGNQNQPRTVCDMSSPRFWLQGFGLGGDLGSSDMASYGGALGVEYDASEMFQRSCNTFAVGAFAYMDRSDIDNDLFGGNDVEGYGGGLYLRGRSEDGYYGSLLGYIGRSNVDTTNAILGSTGEYDTNNYGIAGNIGKITQLTTTDAIDFRLYALYGDTDGDRFTDSLGLTIDGIGTKSTIVGGFVGYEKDFSSGYSSFVRLGAQYVNSDNSIASNGFSFSPDTDFVVGTVEAGVRAAFSENGNFTASLFGEFGDDIALGGGRISVDISF